jgi:hypothetical protein
MEFVRLDGLESFDIDASFDFGIVERPGRHPVQGSWTT